MKILHVNATDYGGAARAALRLHQSLNQHFDPSTLTSTLRLVTQDGHDDAVLSGPPDGQNRLYRKLLPHLTRRAKRGFQSENTTLHSIAWPDTGLGLELNRRYYQGDFDIANLHWLGDHTLSVEEIGRLAMPLVWTLHDHWAFCGAEHYSDLSLLPSHKDFTNRYEVGYSRGNRPSHEHGPDINRSTWQRKREAWRRPMHLVCPSRWMADCVQRSALMHNWPVAVIPNPIDLSIWSPVEKSLARNLLGLPHDQSLVLFGAMYGTADRRKGADLLFQALQKLHDQVANSALRELRLVVFGQSGSRESHELRFPIHYFGHLHDDLSLRLLYAAADVFVIPSRQDNLPNTGLEAQACGTPVVAFNTCGLADVVHDRVTGALAQPFDPVALADSIQWVLQDRERHRQLSEAARTRAERLWNPARVASQYVQVYEQALAARK